MKVFISWSGERSKAVAEALGDWLSKVIQAVRPFVSTNSIDKGSRWREVLANELEQSRFSIVCLTPENRAAPWILFEAGAISKQQQDNVCTYLFGLEPADVGDPLSQFQATKADKEQTRELIRVINRLCGDSSLSETSFDETFNVWWPRLEQQLSTIPEPSILPKPQREEREILEEILELTRSLSARQGGLVPKKQPLLDYIVKGEWLSSEDARYVCEYYDIPPDQLNGRRFKRAQILKALNELKGAELIELAKEHVRGRSMNVPDIVSEEGSDENSNP